MVADIRRALIEDIDKLVQFLEYYDFCNIKKHKEYISFGRDETSSKKSIVIYYKDNTDCFVTDYARGFKGDVLAFVMKERDVSFSEVIKVAKSCAGVSGYIAPKRKVFGGMLQRVVKQEVSIAPEIDASVLNQYEQVGNKRFLQDGISAQTQRAFGIAFDPEDNNIIIPIYRSDGVLMGVKARQNRDADRIEQKYYYPVPCQMSLTLYGYSQNYSFLMENKTVVVVEAEKSVMQAYQMGFRNVVALGSSSLSKKQAQLIVGLRPKKVMFMMDEGLAPSVVDNNCLMLERMIVLREIKICVWKPGSDVPPKSSPTDLGKERFIYACREEMEIWKV